MDSHQATLEEDVTLLNGQTSPSLTGQTSGLPLGQLRKIVRHVVTHKKPIAALCQRSLILAALDAIRGGTVATYEALAADIERAGGKFKNTEVAVERNLVTSRTWMDLPFFMREFLMVLRNWEKAVAAEGKVG